MLKLSFKQQVFTGFAISLLFVLISAITSYLSVVDMGENGEWQNHTYKIINLTREIETELLNAETGMNGYILTQKAEYLNPYSKNESKILPSIKELKNLVSDTPNQLDRVESLETYAAKKIIDMQQVLHANLLSKNLAVDKILANNGEVYKDSVFSISTKIINAEMQLLKQKNENTSRSESRTIFIVLLSAFIIFCLILFLFSYIQKTFNEQKLTELKIRESNDQLERLSTENTQKNWLLSGTTAVNEAMRGEQKMDELATNIITKICNYLNAPIGALFLVNHSKNKCLQLTGSYAYELNGKNNKEYKMGEGLVGQTALEMQSKFLEDIPADYIKVNSGLGSTVPASICLTPVLFENETIAVIEIGLNAKSNKSSLLFLNRISESIGVAINSAVARIKLQELFEQTQQQAEELESQQEELRTTNEELVYKSEELQASEEELRVQQEELRQTNVELEEKARQLEERNSSINQAREAIKLKVDELELSSKYKSEFLSNMSHELRTPLNSILILAGILKENKSANLNEDQIKYANVIHNAGADLLTLINDILDLSKLKLAKLTLTWKKPDLHK